MIDQHAMRLEKWLTMLDKMIPTFAFDIEVSLTFLRVGEMMFSYVLVL